MRINEVLHALTDCGVPAEVASQAVDAITRNRLQEALDLCVFSLPDSDPVIQEVAKSVVREAFRSQYARQAEQRQA